MVVNQKEKSRLQREIGNLEEFIMLVDYTDELLIESQVDEEVRMNLIRVINTVYRRLADARIEFDRLHS